MQPIITICTVNYNSAAFIEVMLEAFSRLTANPYKVIIRDNGSRWPDYRYLQGVIRAKGYDNVELYRAPSSLSGSMAHGEALNELLGRIDTLYGVIMDADATFLMKGWDETLISRTNDARPLYGTQADIGSGKPEDFPLMFALLFRTDVLKSLKIDFRPKNVSAYQDTGWELREKYLAAGYRGGLLYSFNTRSFRGGPFAKVISTEYYDSADARGHIFAAHFGRGSAPAAKRLLGLRSKRTLFSRGINKCLQYGNVLLWKRDKRRWIAICRKIISNQ